jgi:hypothetical protein
MLGSRTFACQYETDRWKRAGLPALAAPEEVFTRALRDVVGGAGASSWSERLNCSNNGSEVGRLFKFYLEQNPKHLNLLALDIADLARAERQQTTQATAKRLAKVFEREEVKTFFSTAGIASAVERLWTGQVDYSAAMFSILEGKLADPEKGQLQTLILGLDR